MHIGVTFPQNEIGADPAAICEYIQTIESLGYRYLVIFDHVLGADPIHRLGWMEYTQQHLFHEPFVLFGYLAALTYLGDRGDHLTSAPDRAGCQAGSGSRCAERRAIASGVGSGWNPVEFEALGMDFHVRSWTRSCRSGNRST